MRKFEARVRAVQSTVICAPFLAALLFIAARYGLPGDFFSLFLRECFPALPITCGGEATASAVNAELDGMLIAAFIFCIVWGGCSLYFRNVIGEEVRALMLWWEYRGS